jgi:hypothetical protein
MDIARASWHFRRMEPKTSRKLEYYRSSSIAAHALVLPTYKRFYNAGGRKGKQRFPLSKKPESATGTG